MSSLPAGGSALCDHASAGATSHAHPSAIGASARRAPHPIPRRNTIPG
jgi:hypothetical protein